MAALRAFLHRWQNITLLILIVLAGGLPRGLAISEFVTTDEPLWVTRSANFYYALAHGDFANTYQREHPGVTVMWAGTAAFLLRYPEYRDSGRGQVSPAGFHDYLERKSAVITPLELLKTARAIMVLVQIAILAASYLYAGKLIGVWPAFLVFLLIAFEPFHLALTRLLHLDGLFSNFVLLSVLAFVHFLKYRRRYDLWISAAAAGLGLLTKSPALFVVPVIGLLTVWDIWQAFSRRADPPSFRLFWGRAWPGLAWLAICAGVFVALWPAMWVHPLQTLANIYTLTEEYVEYGHLSALFFNGQVIPDGDLGLNYTYFYPLTYLWRTTPVVLAGLLLAGWGFFKRWKPFDQAGVRLTTAAMLLTAVVFLVGFTFPLKKFDRYLLPAYAPLDIFAGLGWYSLGLFLAMKKPARFLHYSPAILGALVVAIQAAGALSTFPYYLAYYNPVMGGSRRAPEVMQIGWGEGLNQAAQYLNQIPKAQRLKVISWYDTGCFSYYFKGEDRDFWIQTEISEENWKRFLDSDYAVIYISQQQRQLTKPFLEYVSQLKPEHTVWINGIEYARVYRLR